MFAGIRYDFTYMQIDFSYILNSQTKTPQVHLILFQNLELSSLLKASEKSRTDMESMLKAQNEGKKHRLQNTLFPFKYLSSAYSLHANTTLRNMAFIELDFRILLFFAKRFRILDCFFSVSVKVH